MIDKISTFSWDIFPYFMIMVTVIGAVNAVLFLTELFGACNPLTWILVYSIGIGSIFIVCFFQVMHNVFRGKIS